MPATPPPESRRDVTEPPVITVRPGTPADSRAIARVAARDSAKPPRAPVLVAERDGRLVAALSLADGSCAADPFERTAAAVAMLRLHAEEHARLPNPAPRRKASRRQRPLRLAGGLT